MPTVNFITKQIQYKIVYYGTGLGGKTTNLKYIHSQVASKDRTELIIMATETERTLYFDYLGLDLGDIQGMQAKFSIYTVPGQWEYSASRKLLLNGVDGIVFVSDSSPSRRDENKKALLDMIENLATYKRKLVDIPCVIQYNKRDLTSVLPISVMENDLNLLKVPAFEASAIEGYGVFSTLKGITKLVCELDTKV